ncbi:hypothetical protein C8R46DRAFT_1357758 [Mycena filopes]|nr:hypothetical protein C8R46DRAFT_1357758 [Mycena filopes]
MFPTQSYRSSVPTNTNPREKYLAALAEAKAAEAEYLAAERLQQEEDALRTRLEQIQALKAPQQAPSHHYQPAPAPFAPFQQQPPFHQPYFHPQPQFATIPAPNNNHFDLEQLRAQIAAQERTKLLIEQEEEQRALKRDEEQRAIRREKALRQEAQQAKNLEARRARLEALTQSALYPQAQKVRFAVEAEEAPRRQCRPHAHARPEFHDSVDITPFLTGRRQLPAQQAQPQQKQEEVQLEDLFGQLFGRVQQEKPIKKATPAPAPQPRAVGLEQLLQQVFGAEQVKQQAPQPKPKATPPAPQAVDLGEFLQHVFGAKQAAPTPAPQSNTQEPAASQSIDLGELLQHVFGGAQTEQAAAPAAPKAAPTPTPTQQPADVHTINLGELLQHVFGASGASQQTQAGPSGTKQAAPTPAPAPAAQSTLTPTAKPAAQSAPAPTPAPAAQPTHGFEQILNHFLGGNAGNASAPNQVDMQQLMSMFLGGPHAHSQAQPHQQASTSKVPETSSSSSANSTLKTELEARRTQSSEERDLEEAIRMSLAEAQTAPAPASPTTASNKGKAPAPAPVKDASTSAAEVAAIDATFTALANEFVFPAELDFGSSSRSASPARSASPTPSSATNDSATSVIARLSYSARNQPVRFYHQALSGLLGQLDAVESFGDEGVRKERKEVVGRVEGALDEVEKVVEARWRRVVGREERKEEKEEEAVVVSAEDASEEEVPVVAAAEPTPEPAAAAAIPEVEVVATPAAVPESEPVVAKPELSSYSPSAASSYPPSAAESVETLHPVAAPAPAPAPASPAPSDSESIDTFLLPATDAPVVKKPASKEDAEAEVGSDWSEVDA